MHPDNGCAFFLSGGSKLTTSTEKSTGAAPSVGDILGLLEAIAPSGLAADWDNVGLLVGSPDQEVRGILVALDPTVAVLEEAIGRGCNLVLTHHPVIFKRLKAINPAQPIGRLLKKALGHNLAVIGCHTNLDLAAGGVNDTLAKSLGLTEVTGLQDDNGAAGFGRIGNVPPLGPGQFIRHLAEVLGRPVFSVAGALPSTISRVAVCGGSGSDVAEAALACGAQVFITGEVKHSVARWAEAAGFCVVDAGHFSTEKLVVPVLADILRSETAAKGWQVVIATADVEKDPWNFYGPDGLLLTL